MSADNLAGYEASAGTDLMVIRYDYRPMTFAKLERHSNVTQCFVPLEAMPWAMVVAPTGARNRRAAG